MHNNKICILLAVHNGEWYIKEQIQSILKQTFKPSKTLVNIDQSDDRTCSIVQEYGNKKTLRLKSLIQKEDLG